MMTQSIRKTRNPEQTRSDLLRAAYTEILESGFQAASLERILANTSVSKGALYHHFSTKRDLGLAVIEEVIAPQLATRWFAPFTEHDDPLASLQRILEEKIKMADESVIRYGCPLNNLIQEMSPLDEGFRHGLQQILDRWVEVMASALADGQLARKVRADVEPEEVALFIVAAIEGCVGLGKNAQSVEAYQRCLRQLQLYVKSLTA
ncbi:TetR/AcrR family transcriptional regulator [Acidithiobacillus ferriphilus]|uniref:TetR/AcrR family transcriptional regulator n=1 Tax=Acidithiobacillus ferriphilus TaxID=1689834 RepID=UPI001C0758D9|nr:TetR/AcrR family transcriptional regulator [Acidithiobacillus ferriphilus]MEB8537363.1 TetR/AcrR family transcriptional regulator [Acidithiobacillus ferriphilus]